MNNEIKEYLKILESKINNLSGGGGGGTVSMSYTDLTNKPQIKGVTLTGNKSFSDLGLYEEEPDLVTIKNTEIDELVNLTISNN